jgi:Putative prokaryotic signal transducing protein
VERRYSGSLVLVYMTPSITDGYLARGRLEAEGIPVMVKGEGEGPYRMGPVLLYVPEEIEVQAMFILDEIRSGRLEVMEDEDLLEETDWSEAESEIEEWLLDQ